MKINQNDNNINVFWDKQNKQPVEQSDKKDYKSIFSKYVNEKDRDLTVEEQINFIEQTAMSDKDINEAVQNGFNLKAAISNYTKNLKPFTNIIHDENIAERATFKAMQMNTQSIIEKIKKQIAMNKPELESDKKTKGLEVQNDNLPKPEMGDKFWGMEEEHTEYIEKKLGNNYDIDPETLNNIFAKFDYAAFKNGDFKKGIIDSSFSNYSEYLDKNESGVPQDTYVLDVISNMYKLNVDQGK